MSKAKQFDLQDRLVDYAVRIIALSEALPDTKAGKHVASQILRSGTSPAPNYGEAQSAESKADFVHKLKVALKELARDGDLAKGDQEGQVAHTGIEAHAPDQRDR